MKGHIIHIDVWLLISFGDSVVILSCLLPEVFPRTITTRFHVLTRFAIERLQG